MGGGSPGALDFEGIAELEVTLSGEAELARSGQRSEAIAFALEDHEEFAGDFIVGGDGKGPGVGDEGLSRGVELQRSLVGKRRGKSNYLWRHKAGIRKAILVLMRVSLGRAVRETAMFS